MALHPFVASIIGQFRRQELHAARSGRELMAALAATAADSTASTSAALAAELEAAIDAVLEVLPAYAPPLNVMHQVMAQLELAAGEDTSLPELRQRLTGLAQTFREWSEQARPAVAAAAAALIRPGATVFSYTLSETVVATLSEARRQGIDFRLRVSESRPNRDGLATAARAHALGIVVEVSIDACLGDLIRPADLMLVGAEAILEDGSAVCKVGTYPAALVARAYGCPVYVVVDTYKFNASSLLGLPLWLQPLSPAEVTPAGWTETAAVVGHWFDVTPAPLIRAIVTERGLIGPAACSSVMQEMPLSARLAQKLTGWLERQQLSQTHQNQGALHVI